MLPGLIFDDPALRRTAPHLPGEGAAGPAFALDEPVSVMSPVVFASPHSGRLYPEGFIEECAASMLDLRRIEDAYVDRILSEVHRSGAPMIYGLVGRACIDLNRSEAEMDPAMFSDPLPEWRGPRSPRVEAGLGCIPRVAFNGTPIYRRKLTLREAEQRLEGIYRPYHRALSALMRRAQAMFGQAWLIDCHSMPADAEPSSRSPDIVIGDRFGASCGPGLAGFVESLFRQRGYTTARNAPYAGGFATLTHGQPADGRHALQIEIRRRLYLDEHRVEPTDGLLVLRRDMTAIAAEISAYTRDIVGLSSGNIKKNAALDASAAKVLGRKRP
ncbi:MAG: N-formylglutamate amidohydrolase [Alphaproteobacteria bacterium]|nr:N-formylglutamate amidohydrolase [Alphaproteobacteria bacterium]